MPELGPFDLPVKEPKPCSTEGCTKDAVNGMGCPDCNSFYYGCDDHFVWEWGRIKAGGQHSQSGCTEVPVTFKVVLVP